MCSEFKAYHFEIVDRLETDEDAKGNRSISTNTSERRWSILTALIGHLLSKPQPDDPSQATMSGRLVDRQMDLIDGSMKTIKRVLDDPKFVDYNDGSPTKSSGF